MFNSKEKKQKKAEEEARQKADAEFEAKFAAKQERKKVEKIIAEMEKSAQNLVAKAAEAKMKGQGTIYRNYVSALKIARARKTQAETFLAQMDAMQEMQSITNSSKELLGSMGKIMSSLGKLTLDRNAMIESQRDFARVQQDLDRQGATIESYLSGTETMLPDDTEGSISDVSVDSEIDNEINAYIAGNAMGRNPAGASGSSSEVEAYKNLLNN